MNDQSKQREAAIEVLKQAFSTGHLDLEVYETRVAAAENALTVSELENLIADLPKSTVPILSEVETVNCRMSTKELSGSTLRTKKLVVESSMSTLTIDYLKNEPPKGTQEICINLNMSTLVLRLPDDVVVENSVQDTMSTFKEYRNRYYDPAKPRTILTITGTARMSTIRVKRKRYWFFSKKK